MASDIDIIQHLIEVEKEAAQMVKDAHLEADKQLLLARENADKEFKSRYQQIVQDLEKEEKDKKEKIALDRNSALEQYRKSLEEGEKDLKAFNSLLDKLLS